MNIALDLLFVVGFGIAIEGVAYATIISVHLRCPGTRRPPQHGKLQTYLA